MAVEKGGRGKVRRGDRQRGQRGSENIMGNPKEYPVGESVGREVNDAGLAKKKTMGNPKEYPVCNERERSHDEQWQGTNGTRAEGRRADGK